MPPKTRATTCFLMLVVALGMFLQSVICFAEEVGAPHCSSLACSADEGQPKPDQRESESSDPETPGRGCHHAGCHSPFILPSPATALPRPWIPLDFAETDRSAFDGPVEEIEYPPQLS